MNTVTVSSSTSWSSLRGPLVVAGAVMTGIGARLMAITSERRELT